MMSPVIPSRRSSRRRQLFVNLRAEHDSAATTSEVLDHRNGIQDRIDKVLKPTGGKNPPASVSFTSVPFTIRVWLKVGDTRTVL